MFNVYLCYYCSITFQISIIATISAHIAGKDNVSTGKPDIIHDKGMSASLLSLDSLFSQEHRRQWYEVMKTPIFPTIATRPFVPKFPLKFYPS